MPPTYSGSASKTVTGAPPLLSTYAAVRPAGPAPMTATVLRLPDVISELCLLARAGAHLRALVDVHAPVGRRGQVAEAMLQYGHVDPFVEIGRASCRER